MFYNTDEFAESATYTPNGGSGSSVTVIDVSDPEDFNQDQGIRNRAASSRKKVRIRQSEAASPAYKDTVTIGSETWTVLNASPTSDDLEWVLELIKDEKPSWG